MAKIHNLITLIKQVAASPFGIALSVAIVWQVLFTAFGAFADVTTHNIFEHFSETPRSISASILGHTNHWDGGWYGYIVDGGYYNQSSASPVFYPLFPLLILIIKTLSFNLITPLAAGLIVNTFALAGALYALYFIAGYFIPKKYAWWVSALFLASPAAFFMHMFYTEAVFCAVAFFAYLFALRRRWIFMGIVLGLLTATRLPALLFIGLCTLEYLRAHEWSLKQAWNKHLLSFLVAPSGFILYGIFLWAARGDFFAMFSSYDKTSDWVYQVFNPNIFHTLQESIVRLQSVLFGSIPFDEGQAINFFLPLAGLFILLLASIYLIFIRRQDHIGIPLGLFGIAAMIFFTLNSNVVSVHRYLLPCIGIYLAIAYYASRQKYRQWIVYTCLYGGILMQSYLLLFFVNGYFAG